MPKTCNKMRRDKDFPSKGKHVEDSLSVSAILNEGFFNPSCEVLFIKNYFQKNQEEQVCVDCIGLQKEKGGRGDASRQVQDEMLFDIVKKNLTSSPNL